MNKTILLLCLMLAALFSQAQENANIAKGNEYYQMSQYDLAAAQYRKALEAEPNNAIAQYNLANTLQRQKKYDEAVQLLDGLAESTNDKKLKEKTYYNRGVAYSHLKNLDQSIESYKSALRLDPTDTQARENLQKALLEQKKKQQEQNQKKPEPKMSQKEAEQKLKMLQQKEKELQQQKQNKNRQNGAGQAQDW